MRLTIVLFPAPFAPTSATCSPAPISRLTSRSTGFSPYVNATWSSTMPPSNACSVVPWYGSGSSVSRISARRRSDSSPAITCGTMIRIMFTCARRSARTAKKPSSSPGVIWPSRHERAAGDKDDHADDRRDRAGHERVGRDRPDHPATDLADVPDLLAGEVELPLLGRLRLGQEHRAQDEAHVRAPGIERVLVHAHTRAHAAAEEPSGEDEQRQQDGEDEEELPAEDDEHRAQRQADQRGGQELAEEAVVHDVQPLGVLDDRRMQPPVVGPVEVGLAERVEALDHAAAQVGDRALRRLQRPVAGAEPEERAGEEEAEDRRAVGDELPHVLVRDHLVEDVADEERDRQEQERLDDRRGHARGHEPARVAEELGEEAVGGHVALARAALVEHRLQRLDVVLPAGRVHPVLVRLVQAAPHQHLRHHHLPQRAPVGEDEPVEELGDVPVARPELADRAERLGLDEHRRRQRRRGADRADTRSAPPPRDRDPG